MLVKLQLENYRGFEHHTLLLRPRTIIVGQNNAGKSTIVEALRLVAMVTARLPYSTFRPAPAWLQVPGAARGILPSLERVEFDFETAQHGYADPPSTITATFGSGATIRIFIGRENEIFAAAVDPQKGLVTDRAGARQLPVAPVAILPQIGPLALEETLLTEEYVRRMQDTPLASQHFRNQLLLNSEAFDGFKELVDESWPGVLIQSLLVDDAERESGLPLLKSRRLRLLVRDGEFVGEAARMGSGLQMWLQTMWLLARTPREATVILDEPDVYMHPDLERRLVRVLRGRHTQTIIATHSAEIMSEVDPDDVLVVDRKLEESAFAPNLPAVQKVIDRLGGVHNLQLARLWSARRFLLVEGEDIDYLGPVHATLFPAAPVALQSLPHADVGGWGGWERAVGSANAMRNAVGQEIMVYCLFDRDYYLDPVIAERYRKAADTAVHLHVWARKELENYLLVPTALQRVIAARTREGITPPAVGEIIRAADVIADDLRELTEECFLTSYTQESRGTAPGTALRRVREHMNMRWATREGRWALVSGKEMLSRLSQWAKENYGASFSAVAVARALGRDEIPVELRQVLVAIETGRSLTRFEEDQSAAPPVERAISGPGKSARTITGAPTAKTRNAGSAGGQHGRRKRR